MENKIEIKATPFVEMTALVPKSWGFWFFGLMSESAPFSWGDNNRTLVTAERVHEHCSGFLEMAGEDYGIDQSEIDSFLRVLEELGDLYIDLEN